MLVRRGAQFERFNTSGYAPLHQAAMKGDLALVQGLLDRGANINVLNTRNGWTALAEACSNGHLEVVQLLLAKGALTEIQIGTDISIGKTALIKAAEHGHTAVVSVLLDEGKADVDRTDNEGRTALFGQSSTIARIRLAPSCLGGRIQTSATPTTIHCCIGLRKKDFFLSSNFC